VSLFKYLPSVVSWQWEPNKYSLTCWTTCQPSSGSRNISSQLHSQISYLERGWQNCGNVGVM